MVGPDTLDWRRWGGLLFGLGALLGIVFLACVALFLYDRQAKGQSAAEKDTEKGLVAVTVRPGQLDCCEHNASQMV